MNAASPEDTHIRKTYATTMSLRNLVNATSEFYFLNPLKRHPQVAPQEQPPDAHTQSRPSGLVGGAKICGC